MMKDLVGMRFSRLVVISRSDSEVRKDGHGTFARWLCKCDCGKEIIVRGNNLRMQTTRSCGCLKEDSYQYKIKNKPSEGGFLRVFRAYKKGCEKRNLEFSLTLEQFAHLTQQNCHYCGTSPQTLASTGNSYSNYFYNGIDRMDNNRGYLLENCVPCCTFCNFAKRTKDYNSFIKWLDDLAIFRMNKKLGLYAT